MRFPTKAIHTGEEPDFSASGDVVVPIHLSSTFARKDVDRPSKGYEYSRSGNPTRHALEKRLAALEGAKHGLAFSSGLGAETTVLASLKKGSHVVAFDDLYGGTKRIFNVFRAFGVEFTYVDARNPDMVKRAIRKNTDLIWLESPTNPLLKLCDIEAISEIAGKKGVSVLVDNTFASPYIQRPLELGADIVLHSTTKYIGGHSDVVGGALTVNNEKIHEKLKFLQNALGPVPSPFDCFLTLRGTKTLALRMERHCENAETVAQYLESHEKVERVFYPGLKSHDQHELAIRQMRRFGGMVSFELKGGLKVSKKFLASLNLFYLAESLGGVESLIESPALMTHAAIPKAEREKAGLRDGLIRASVGIEDKDDLLEDIEGALKRI